MTDQPSDPLAGVDRVGMWRCESSHARDGADCTVKCKLENRFYFPEPAVREVVEGLQIDLVSQRSKKDRAHTERIYLESRLSEVEQEHGARLATLQAEVDKVRSYLATASLHSNPKLAWLEVEKAIHTLEAKEE